MKRILLAILAGILLIALIWGFIWYSKTQKAYKQSKSIIIDYQKWQGIQETIQNEYDRCQQFISQQQGEFGSFEYCKKFLDWSKGNGLVK